MKITTPLPDTEQSLFYSAINALRIAGQEKLADDFDQRMENLLPDNKFTALATLNKAADQIYNIEGDKWQEAYEVLEALIGKLNQQPTQPIKTPKVAIYIKGGIVRSVRSNISTELDIEIVDADCIPYGDEDRWKDKEFQTELEFGNY